MRFEQFLRRQRRSASPTRRRSSPPASASRTASSTTSPTSWPRASSTAASRAAIALSSSWTIVPRRLSSVFAVLKAGAVFSPVNPSTKADKLAYILNNCRARGLITQQKTRRRRRRRRRGCALRRADDRRRRRSGAARLRALERRADGAEVRAARRRSRHRHRPRDAHLHLGLDRLPQGRDDDASERRRRRDLDHHLPREHARRHHPQRAAGRLRLRPLSGADGGEGRRHAGAGEVVRLPAGRSSTAAPRRRSPACRWCRPWRRSSSRSAISSPARCRTCATSPTPPRRCRRRTSSGCRRCSRTSRSIPCTA